MDDDEPLDLRRFLRLLWRRAWLVLLCGAIFAAAGLLVALQQDDRYQASASVQVLDPNEDQVFEGTESRVETRDLQSQTKVITSNGVRSLADDALGEQAEQVVDVSASIQPDTTIVNLRVVATTPEAARDGANAIAEAYLERRREAITTTFDERATALRDRAAELNAEVDDLTELIQDDPSSDEADVWRDRRAALVIQAQDFARRAGEQDVEASVRSGNLQVVEAAELPDGPFEPRPARTALLCGLVGLLFGIVLVLLLDRLGDKVTSKDAASVAGLPVLGSALRDADLATNLRHLGRATRSIMLTSPSGSEGTAEVTADVAIGLAEADLNVVAVSADLGDPTLAPCFDVEESDAGLVTVLSGDASIPDVARRVPTTHGMLYVIPAGQGPTNPAELLGSEAMSVFLDWLNNAGSDWVLFDGPPVLSAIDAVTIGRAVDGVVVVCVPDQTKRADLREAIGRLREGGANVLGLVVNGDVAPNSGARQTDDAADRAPVPEQSSSVT